MAFGRNQTDFHSERGRLGDRAKNPCICQWGGNAEILRYAQNDMLQNVCQKNKNLRPCNADFVFFEVCGFSYFGGMVRYATG